MKAVRFHRARRPGGPPLRGRAGSGARARRGAGPRSRLRAELPRSLGAARPRARHAFRCRTSRAATSPARSPRSVAAPDVAVGRRVMLQPGISCGRCDACLSGRDNECPQIRGARLPQPSRRLRRVRQGSGAEPHPDSRRHRFRSRGGVSADVSDRLAHADDARAAASAARMCWCWPPAAASARRRSRSRRCTAPACSRPPARRKSSNARARSGPTDVSTITSRTSPRRSCG